MHFLILGGGSAGCVLATRLSENPSFRVTLVEAGRNLTRDTMEPHVRSRYVGRAYVDVNYVWPDLNAYFGVGSRSGQREFRRYEQAKVLGGGSVINAMTANRGAPSDYQEWADLGAAGWSFDDVLPYFRKLEADRDFSGPLHGQDGPLPIRRIDDDKMSSFVTAIQRTLVEKGIVLRDDQNGEWSDGLYKCAVSLTDNGERNPTSAAYLTDAVRARPNLKVMTGCLAEKLLFEGSTIRAAQFLADDGSRQVIEADQIILSAGAIHTPAILQRSGIGAGDILSRHGIAVLKDLPGVGKNLGEHPNTAVAAFLPRQHRAALDEHHDQMVWRWSSGLEGAPAADVHIGLFARTGWHNIGQRLGAMFLWINKSYSKGHVAIRSQSAQDEPAVDLNLLADERDLSRMREAFRLCAETLVSPGLEDVALDPFPACYSKRVSALSGPGMLNSMKRSLFASLLDASGPMRGLLIKSFVTRGATLKELLANQDKLDRYLRDTTSGTWHASGTCRMGAESDPHAVTDPAGKVFGINGLRICDASLMPTIPCANTNIPTIMVAEKIADAIKAEVGR